MEQLGNCTTSSQKGEGGSLEGGSLALMVFVSVIMGLLAVLLLVLGFLGRLSGAATTHPTVRFFLWVVFALFLPLTSYMFSEAKDSQEKLRAQLILMWMLLAELLRKKLEGVSKINESPLQGVNKQSTWDAVDQIVRIAWLGYLIYRYAIKWVLVTLWAFSIVKVVQRVAAIVVAKRSFALGENPHLIAGYMRQLSEGGGAKEQQRPQETAAAAGGGEEKSMSAVMRACEYVIMGEDKVESEAGPHGYRLKLPADPKERENMAKKMVTVGDVWRLAADGDALFASRQLRLKDLCLSFALYKLLRRRFEEYPCAEAGSRQSLDFLRYGLLGDDKVDISPHGRRLPKEDKGERVFRVIEDELSFLSDYYYSTIPLMLSDLWFFLLDCVLVFVIPLFCSIVIIVSIVIVRNGVIRCLFDKLINKKTVPILYDVIITLLLIATLFLLELAEVVFYVLSDWIMVSLLCTYVKKRSRRARKSMSFLSGLALTAWRMVKTYLKRASFGFNQYSVLEPRSCTLPIFSQLVLRWRFLRMESKLLQIVLHRRYLGVRSTPVPKEVKAAIVKYLVDNKEVLRQNGVAENGLLQAFKRDGAAETIIVWHIATCLYEMKHPPSQQSDDHVMQANRRIAETLSKYCAYLVALAPELLPNDTVGTKTAYKAAVKEIQDAILNGGHGREAGDFELVTSIKNPDGMAAERGAELGHQLVEGVPVEQLVGVPVEQLVGDGRQVQDGRLVWEEWRVWKELADRWTEIVVYIAPSKDVKSHARALAHGGEFITQIWALLTHGGILQWHDPPPPAAAAAAAAADESPV